MTPITPDKAVNAAPVRLSRIMEAIEREHGITASQWSEWTRGRVPEAREMVVYLAKKHTTLSYPEIARGTGMRHHATFIKAHQRAKGKIEDPDRADPEFAATIARCEHLLGVRV